MVEEQLQQFKGICIVNLAEEQKGGRGGVGGEMLCQPGRRDRSQQLCLAFTLPPRGKSFLSLQAAPLPHQRQDKKAAEESLHCQHPTPALTAAGKP